MNKKQIKKTAKRVWKFLWYEDSLASWIVTLLLAFIIVKFIFFPLLSLAFSTPLPLVVVESESMYHQGQDFDYWWNQSSEWYENKQIKYEDTEDGPFKNGLDMGDIIVVSGRGEYEVGDIIIFEAGARHPIIHRIVKIRNLGSSNVNYATKGDNNPSQLENEEDIEPEAVMGKAVARIPKAGWIKLFFVKIWETLDASF
jgi:signal peptidase I